MVIHSGGISRLLQGYPTWLDLIYSKYDLNNKSLILL